VSRAKQPTPAKPVAEHEHVLREASKIVEALGKTLAPFCEVVLHDLTRPDHAIVRIENNLSKRKVGGAATELGLARISDPNFPDQVVNYVNKLPNGRPLKSTSIGLRDSEGRFIAAICLNLDVGFFGDVVTYFQEITRATPLDLNITEFETAPRASLEDMVRQFAAQRNTQPGALSAEQRHELVAELKAAGMLELRGALSRIAGLLGVSRTTLYHYIA
jgi:predicted transcriptional regulator YheO